MPPCPTQTKETRQRAEIGGITPRREPEPGMDVTASTAHILEDLGEFYSIYAAPDGGVNAPP
jgi:hypothetical protein